MRDYVEVRASWLEANHAKALVGNQYLLVMSKRVFKVHVFDSVDEAIRSQTFSFPATMFL